MDQYKKIYISGIGGIGLSALTEFLIAKNKEIVGSDTNKSSITEKFEKKGIKINYKQEEKNLDKSFDRFIHSKAIDQNNKEYKAAKNLKINTLTYPEALAQIAKDYYLIAVAGTHGKSTTASILAQILKNSKKGVNAIIGTKVPALNNENYYISGSKIMLIEACEYQESFLNYKPDLMLILNTEKDHLDYFKTEENYKNAYIKFAKNLKENGKIILSKKDIDTQNLLKDFKNNIVLADKFDYEIKPQVIGDFNKENAQFAAKAAEIIGVDPKIIEKEIKKFKGTWRRMEIKDNSYENTIFIDDYGHHPTAVKKTISAIKTHYKKNKLLLIFQPHQFNRTHTLIKEFKHSFKEADQVIVPNIYKSRDTKEDIAKISVEKFKEIINKESKNVLMEVDSTEKTINYIKENYKNFDIILTMGAGDIYKIHEFI